MGHCVGDSTSYAGPECWQTRPQCTSEQYKIQISNNVSIVGQRRRLFIVSLYDYLYFVSFLCFY